MIHLTYVGGGGNQAIPGIPARDIACALPTDSAKDREAADYVGTELQIKRLVTRHKGENPVLDADGKPVPTGLYEYRETAAPRRRSRGG